MALHPSHRVLVPVKATVKSTENTTVVVSKLHRITGLVSRIKYGNRGIFVSRADLHTCILSLAYLYPVEVAFFSIFAAVPRILTPPPGVVLIQASGTRYMWVRVVGGGVV